MIAALVFDFDGVIADTERIHLAAFQRALADTSLDLDTPAGKPAPDPYVEAAHRLGVDPHRCAAIEDSRWGVQSAIAAGMTCIAVTTNYKAHELPGAVIVVPSLEAVTLEMIEGL